MTAAEDVGPKPERVVRADGPVMTRARDPGDVGRLSSQAATGDALYLRPFTGGPSRNRIVSWLQPGQRHLVLALVPNGLSGESAITHALVLPCGSARPGWTWWTAELAGGEEP